MWARKIGRIEFEIKAEGRKERGTTPGKDRWSKLFSRAHAVEGGGEETLVSLSFVL